MGSLMIPPLQELPTVKADPIPFTPPQTEQLQPWQGFAGGGGQVANIADKFLQGWMAGKHTSEIKMRQNAADQIGNTRAAVDVAAQTIANLQRQGKKEGDADFDQAKKALSGAWNSYLTIAQAYVAPPEDQKKGLGSRIKAAVTPQGPQLFQAAAIDALKKVDPMSLVPTMSPQEKEANIHAQGAQVDLDTHKKIASLQDQYQKATADLYAAQKSGKSADEIKAIRADQESISTQLAGYGQHIPQAPVPGQSDLALGDVEQQKKLQASRSTALDALKGGTKFESLPQDQQLALTGKIPEDTRSIYLQNVRSPQNPSGQFGSQLEAVQAMQRDAQKYYPRGYWTPLEEIKRDVSSTLSHELQDPNTARQYGLPAPLKPGEEAPEWLVAKMANQEYERRGRSAAAPKVDWQQAKIWRTGVLDEAKVANPEYADFVQTLDSGGQKYNIFVPPKPRPVWGKMPFTDTDKDRGDQYNKFRQDVLNRALTQGTKEQVYEQFPELRDLMGAPGPTSGGGAAATGPLRPPPNAPVGTSQSPANPPVTVRVTLVGGESKDYTITSPDQFDRLMQNAPPGSKIVDPTTGKAPSPSWMKNSQEDEVDSAGDDVYKPTPGKK